MLLAFILTFGYASAASHESKRHSVEGPDIGSDTWHAVTEDVNQIVTTPIIWPESLKIWTHRDATGYRDVRIDTGVVRGYLHKESDGDYFRFLGIPYVAPPTSSNRFMAPFPPKPWLNMFYANRTVQCPQQGVGDEDCLVINVFSPTSLSAQLPVLVYIHGGSFLMGSGPTKGLGLLVNQNIIVVTFNYRLGVLGFLCLGIEEALGNLGLKDQTAALQWVQRNIQQFGGDPSQVTLYGMSAGAASAELHVLSGFSDGLFHNAIIESGSATSVWAVDSEPINTAKQFTNLLNPPSNIRNLEDLVHFLQHIPANELSIANYKFYRSLTDGTFGFVPCVEHKYNEADAFLLEPPIEILETRSVAIPVMFLYSSLEGLFLRSPEYYELDYKIRMNENFLAFIPADLNVDREPCRNPVQRKIKRQYFGNKGIVDDSHLMGYLNYFGDSLILHGLLYSVEMLARTSKKVYLMEFAYKGERGGYEQYYKYINMPGHGDLARNVISTVPALTRSDKLIINRLSRLLANFAKFGDPTPTLMPLLPVKWPVVKPDNMTHLYLDQEFSVRYGYNCSRKQLWDELYNMYRKPVNPVNPFIYI